jgi:hypothetical protein
MAAATQDIMKNILTILFLCLLFAVSGAAQGIRDVDFKNFTYQPYCAGEDTRKVTVKDGEFSSEKEAEGYTDRFYFKVFDITYGDLGGDKSVEAVVLTVCNTGGTGNFTEGFIYRMKDDKPVLVTRIEGGDRADGGLRSATVENGLLVVDANDAGPNGGACCPEFAIKRTYKLTGAGLVESGKPVRRELYPSEPLKFAAGASSVTKILTVASEDRKRFTLGARAGQTMTVKVNSEKISIRLLEDAIVTEGTNAFTARLPKNGTYTIELSNYEEGPVEVSLTVGIK